MTVDMVLEKLRQVSNEKLASRNAKHVKTLDVLGVKMSDIKSIAKNIKADASLASQLVDTHILEAMMLAMFIMPTSDLSIDLLSKWAKQMESSNVVTQGLCRILKDKQMGYELLEKWISNDDEDIRFAGFSFASTYFGSYPLEDIDISLSLEVISQIVRNISEEPLSIQNAMNNAVVMAGLHVPKLVDAASNAAKSIGYILPMKAKNSCNIQSATDYLVRYSDNPKYSRVAKLKLQ